MCARLHATLELCHNKPGQLQPGQVAELLRSLGPLASWWVHPDVWHQAAALGIRWRKPQLPTSAGSCWIVFAQDECMPWPALREAFLLPLQWQERSADSPRLPPKLRQLARSAAQTVHHPDWGLHLHPDVGLEQLCLAELDDLLHVQSGWASVACGLLLATEGGTPQATVWASGGWDPNGGIKEVGHLPAKLRLAAEWGASEFFLPQFQLEAARSSLGAKAGLKLCPLHTGQCDPRQALAEYLAHLDAPPPPPQPEDHAAFKRCARYYLRQPPHDSGSATYYRQALLPAIVSNLRQGMLSRYPDWHPTHLVTIVSGNDVLVELMARVLDVSHVLLLHTPDTPMTERAEQVASRLVQAGIACRTHPIRKQEGVLADVQHAFRYLADVPVSQLAIDLTPGTKLMTYALSRAAPEASWLVYLESRYQDNRPLPGSETLLRWPAGG
jgi:hypothetical protein